MAATLERQWEEALQNERAVKEDYDRHCRQGFPPLSADDEARITALASDIPALWHSQATTNAERQAIVRCLVERVVVDVEPASEETRSDKLVLQPKNPVSCNTGLASEVGLSVPRAPHHPESLIRNLRQWRQCNGYVHSWHSTKSVQSSAPTMSSVLLQLWQRPC